MTNDPVLNAIDTAKWSDDEIDFLTITTAKTEIVRYIVSANLQIEAIRTAYLASINKGKMHCPHCAGELRIRSIYRCSNCSKIWNINEQEEA